MSFWFFLSTMGLLCVVPIHFLSVEHSRLETRFREERGHKIGAALGMISGWGFFLFLFGLWVSPQERFLLNIWETPPIDLVLALGLLSLRIPVFHLVLSVLFLLPGAYLGIKGVTEMGLKVAETHRAERVISSGVYSRVRHPQYLGAVLSHIGVSFIVSGFYSILVTPLVLIINYILCWKEEKELVREFGEDYRKYQEIVPMLVPRIGK
jgi:protein-S-isoprenylcysteine O-methyltransferase Ste14